MFLEIFFKDMRGCHGNAKREQTAPHEQASA